MPNMLAWLTGRDDQTGQPSPLQYDNGPSLRTYNPPPSDQFSSWLAGLLGAGPGASLAHQNFAEGVPKILMATPLGIGMSALDFAHAKAANDPMGMAAAAIGLIPAAGPEARAGVKVLSKALPKDDVGAALSAIHEALNPGAPLPDWTSAKAKAPVNYIDKQNPFDYKQNKFGNYDIFHSGTSEVHDVAQTPAKAEFMVDHLGQLHSTDPNVKGPLWSGVGYKTEQVATKPPAFDYEKDDTGLYHVFDAVSGKTHAVVNTSNEAKGWIAKQTGSTNVPINQISTPSPLTTRAPDLLEAQKLYDAAIAPLAQNLPERAQAQGYTTPAFRGMTIYRDKGVPNPVYNFGEAEHHYSTADPMLADMYSSYLNKHPGWNIQEGELKEGAQVSPLLLDTSNYHYYDAKGAHWASSAGNQRGINEAKNAGKPGVIVDNVWDEPNSTHALGKPNKIFITFDKGASTVKSRFAERFDPSSPNMLHGLAGLVAGTAGATALLGSNKAEASPRGPHISDVMDTINSVFPSTAPLPLQGQRP